LLRGPRQAEVETESPARLSAEGAFGLFDQSAQLISGLALRLSVCGGGLTSQPVAEITTSASAKGRIRVVDQAKVRSETNPGAVLPEEVIRTEPDVASSVRLNQVLEHHAVDRPRVLVERLHDLSCDGGRWVGQQATNAFGRRGALLSKGANGLCAASRARMSKPEREVVDVGAVSGLPNAGNHGQSREPIPGQLSIAGEWVDSGPPCSRLGVRPDEGTPIEECGSCRRGVTGNGESQDRFGADMSGPAGKESTQILRVARLTSTHHGRACALAPDQHVGVGHGGSDQSSQSNLATIDGGRVCQPSRAPVPHIEQRGALVW